MDLKTFACKVCGSIEQLLGEEATVTVKEVRKNNGVILQGLIVMKEGLNISPTIYLDGFWKRYEEGQTFQQTIEQILGLYESSASGKSVDIEFFKDFEMVKERIAYRLVHAEYNRELLEQIPHILFLDLAICFYYAFSSREIGNGTILIYNNHMEMWGTSTEELMRLASENTCRLFQAECQSMRDVMEELLEQHQTQARPGEDEYGILFEKLPMQILSNRQRLQGAACILYPGLLRETAASMSASLYVLPSSVHEVILIADTGCEEPERLREMVREVNATQVEPDEILSDHVYYYDRLKNEVKIVN